MRVLDAIVSALVVVVLVALAGASLFGLVRLVQTAYTLLSAHPEGPTYLLLFGAGFVIGWLIKAASSGPRKPVPREPDVPEEYEKGVLQ